MLKRRRNPRADPKGCSHYIYLSLDRVTLTVSSIRHPLVVGAAANKGAIATFGEAEQSLSVWVNLYHPEVN